MNFTLINRNMPEQSFAILGRTLDRRLSERGCALADDGYALILTVDNNFKDDRYRIEPQPGSVLLTAANAAALHAAVGRFLFASRFDGLGSFEPAAKVIDFTPERPLRGMYFATHFHNFYHDAPIEKVYEVIEDLALRGCNALLVWYDMHHFSSIDQPESQALITRLKAFMRYAKQIGMMASMTMLSNEAFDSSPEELRADWTVRGGYHTELCGHFKREICPSKPGGIEEILRERRIVLEAFADVEPDYVCYWPYDQGGCTCPDCEPWGANGFLRILPHFTKLLHEVCPSTRIIVSAWFFDRFIDGEWEAFYPHLKAGELSEADYIMSFFFRGELPEVIKREGIPEGVRFIDFPEISMYSCEPWGAFGANPLGRFLDETNEKSGHLYAGGYPYSEGIFEDINKHIILGWYSGQHKKSASAVREWAKFELCCDDDALVEAIIRTETALARTNQKRVHPFHFGIKDTSDVQFVYDTIMAYDKKLPENIRKLPRWRMIYLRALLDYELPRVDGYSGRSPICQEAYRELTALYYASSETHRWVRPPLEDEADLR